MSEELGVSVAEPKEDVKKKHYPMWNVVFYNDDFTPMDFVVDMLMAHYGHTETTASMIMYEVHTKGRGIAGSFTRDIAETKGSITAYYAKEAGHPLMVTIEPCE